MTPRFLISRLSALGDVICTLPVASALRKMAPDAEIVWAVDRRFAGAARCCTAINQVVELKPSSSPDSWKVPGEFDAALDMQGLLKSALVVAAARAKEKIGYPWQREGAALFTSKVRPDPTSVHVVDQYVDVARALGADVDRAEFALSPPPEATESVRAKLAERGVTGPYVVLNAGAGWVTKRWPPTHFAEVTNRLVEHSLTPVFIGGKAKPDHEAFAEVEAAGARGAVSLLGETSIPELIALIAESRAHIGGDTGSSHIAAALGVPAIGLYSITRPERNCPYGQRDRCLYDPQGLSRITPDQVWNTLSEALP